MEKIQPLSKIIIIRRLIIIVETYIAPNQKGILSRRFTEYINTHIIHGKSESLKSF